MLSRLLPLLLLLLRRAGFCCQCTMLCAPCTQFQLRKKVLGGNLDDYICCQGYICGNGCCGCKPGECGERSCPACCLCLEVFLCNGFAVSASRQTIMDRYHLRPDPWDNRLIRCNNCLQIFSFICHCLALFNSSFRDLARIIDCIADIFYYMCVVPLLPLPRAERTVLADWNVCVPVRAYARVFVVSGCRAA